jgi:hypothetical protein
MAIAWSLASMSRIPKLSSWVETQRVLGNRDHHEIIPKEAVVATAAAASAIRSLVTLAEGDHWTSNNFIKPLYKYVPTTTTQTTEGITLLLDIHQFSLETDTPDGSAVTPNLVTAPSTAMVTNKVEKRLTQERKQKLDEIGFVWSLRAKRIEDHWDEMFKQLLNYKEQHGDCLVPSRFKGNLKLSKWVSYRVWNVWFAYCERFGVF